MKLFPRNKVVIKENIMLPLASPLAISYPTPTQASYLDSHVSLHLVHLSQER